MIAIVAFLVLSYLTLMGGTTYCQYLLQKDGGGDHRTSSYPAGDKTFCLMAKHQDVFAAHPGESIGVNHSHLFTSVIIDGPVSTGSGYVIANASRAPPWTSRSV